MKKVQLMLGLSGDKVAGIYKITLVHNSRQLHLLGANTLTQQSVSGIVPLALGSNPAFSNFKNTQYKIT